MEDKQDCPKQFNIQDMLDHLRGHVHRLTGQEQSAGFEIAGLIRVLANHYEAMRTHHADDTGLSGPRIGLMFRLFGEEASGNPNGLTPTQLSHNQKVSRNTISALLRGLEEQGLIERTLDPEDKRIFRIRLSEAGRKLVLSVGPQRIHFANQLVNGLTDEEQQQLIELLSKLFRSLQEYGEEALEEGLKPKRNGG